MLSIIVLTKNEEKYLPRLLDSIEKQDFKDFEIIVADADSEDKTREIAKKFGCKITAGGLQSRGRNNGARLARGEYLLFLDADSELPRKFLEINLNEFMKSRAGTATVKIKPLSNKKIDRLIFRLYGRWARTLSKISPHCAGCSIFCKKEVFDRVGGFDEKIVFAEDHNFARRAKRYGFAILPQPIYTSTRRLDKEGRLRIVLKYIYAGIYRLIYKEIDKPIFRYDYT
jgi:glycosyltransferase involved in cell wall biosynthesis